MGLEETEILVTVPRLRCDGPRCKADKIGQDRRPKNLVFSAKLEGWREHGGNWLCPDCVTRQPEIDIVVKFYDREVRIERRQTLDLNFTRTGQVYQADAAILKFTSLLQPFLESIHGRAVQPSSVLNAVSDLAAQVSKDTGIKFTVRLETEL